MAANSTQRLINGNSATIIASGIRNLVVQNIGPYPIYLGDSSVTEINGLMVNPDQKPFSIPVNLTALENIYAIGPSVAGEDTSDVRVLTYTI